MRFRRPKIDPLIVLIILAVILAIFLPARGTFAVGFDIAVKIAIALLFFLYGARLSTREALSGLKNWKLHSLILAFTFVLFPLIGLALSPLQHWLGADMYAGILFLTLVPSTVQSSVAFTSIAKGNVAGAIVAASLSNVVGVVATPLLVLLFMTTDGSLHIDTSVFIDISLQLLAPFIVGQLTQKWTRKLAASPATKIVDRGSIAMVVYSAFSAGMVAGVWSSTGVWEIVFLCVLSVVLVGFMLWFTRFVAEKLGMNRGDVIAAEFCGTKKSLASGLPMASVMFSGGALGLMILPLMLFHQIQLMMCSWLASRYAGEVAGAGAAGRGATGADA
ncbi:Predicted Na+-dependent transporter [Corynebacterium renale]|uniref:bile acid:sodium symporter family protein n=1 Tax=Corynebacterium renale TaxID=1724 RepID=UPI000DA3A7D2|nr:bile acid:sodium symporter family protein [Corynebacterium renale]SQG63621.1 Predicted Na+-dependent transporter [Corynebacterium renale]STD01205.1 Predicted Na+-dependent transporter [Corynebacterium renale]